MRPKGRREPLPRLQSPQPLAGDGGAIAQCPQFCPDDAVGHLWLSEHRGAKTAVDPSDEPFAIDDFRIAADALRYQAWMLDKIRGRVDDTRNKNLIVGNFDRLEIFPFVIVARISGLDADCLRPCFESDINNLYQRQIVGVRTFVIAPADVQPHAVSRKARGRGVEQRNIAFGNFAEELVVREMSILVVSRRCKIGSVYLQ